MSTVPKAVAVSLMLGGLAGVLSGVAVHAVWAQEQNDTHAGHHPEKVSDETKKAEAPKKTPMTMSASMMMRCRMFMQMKAGPTNPAALVAVKDQLGLSQEQVQRLQEILQQSEDQAKGVLTKEQQEKLAPLATMANTCMEMHQEMMQKMKRLKSTMAKEKAAGRPTSGMMCPMVQMMESQGDQPETPPAPAHHETPTSENSGKE